MRKENNDVKACLVAFALLCSAACKTDEINDLQTAKIDKQASTASAAAANTYYLNASSNSAQFQALVNQAVAGAVIRKAPNSFNAAGIEISGNGNFVDRIDLDGAICLKQAFLFTGKAIRFKQPYP